MKVLFVSSGNNREGIGVIVKNQGKSLVSASIDVSYFLIKGKGFLGYLRNIFILKRFLKKNHFDIIHAHYSLTGWVTVLTFPKSPVIVSYMGCDTYGDYNEKGRHKWSSIFIILSAFLLQPFVKAIIVKSENLGKYVYFKKKLHIIPNGIDLELFNPDKKLLNTNNLNHQKHNILFLGDKFNIRKNFKLLKDASLFLSEDVEIIAPFPINHKILPSYLNACDVLVLTSFNEGSPNIIKEAMACNCPVVSTNVGDVQWVIGNTEGCYLTTFDPKDVAEKISLALDYSRGKGHTNGRDRIIELGLDSDTVAKRIIDLYNTILHTKGSNKP